MIPILCKDILPGDKVKINIDSLIESLPMLCPNLQGYKASFDFYFEPWSNLYGWMDNNKRSSTQEILDFARHRFFVSPSSAKNITDLQTRPGVKAGSLLDYLGVPPGYCGDYVSFISGAGVSFGGREFPAEKFLSVLDIYRNYYVNNQENYCSFVSGIEDGKVGETGILRMNLEALDRAFVLLRNQSNGVDLLDLTETFTDIFEAPHAVNTIGQALNYIIGLCLTSPLAGLPLRTYRMDLNRGILSHDVGSVKSTVTLTDGGFSIDTLRFANKMQKLIDRIDISGGRFSDMMRARWGVTPRGDRNVPDYLGSVSEFFGITDVIATASGVNSTVDENRGNSVLGQQAGFAVNRCKRTNSPISFRADQYGTLVCMFSLVPIVTYSQGIEREDLKTTFAEVYDPAFAQLGYQDVDPRELSALPSFDFSGITDVTEPLPWANTALASDSSVGKRVAWSEYMSSLPRAHGLFAYGQDFDYWANNRMYTRPQLPDIGDSTELLQLASLAGSYGPTDFTTYIDPSLQNNLFADTSLTAQNFRLRVNFDIFMRRNIGSRVMPHL